MWLLDESGAYPEAIMPTCEAIFSGTPEEAHIVQAGKSRRSLPPPREVDSNRCSGFAGGCLFLWRAGDRMS